jgi:hypothetical protein
LRLLQRQPSSGSVQPPRASVFYRMSLQHSLPAFGSPLPAFETRRPSMPWGSLSNGLWNRMTPVPTVTTSTATRQYGRDASSPMHHTPHRHYGATSKSDLVSLLRRSRHGGVRQELAEGVKASGCAPRFVGRNFSFNTSLVFHRDGTGFGSWPRHWPADGFALGYGVRSCISHRRRQPARRRRMG